MKRHTAVSVFVLSVVLAALALPAYAEACSCLGPQSQEEVGPYYAERIAEADAAVVAKVLKIRRDEGRPNLADDKDIYSLRIRRTFKGLRDKHRIKVETAAEGATCGLELNKGAKSGLLLYKASGTWRSNLCAQAPPRYLRKGAKVLEESGGKFAGASAAGAGCAKA